jgi:hypothetical protein
MTSISAQRPAGQGQPGLLEAEDEVLAGAAEVPVPGLDLQVVHLPGTIESPVAFGHPTVPRTLGLLRGRYQPRDQLLERRAMSRRGRVTGAATSARRFSSTSTRWWSWISSSSARRAWSFPSGLYPST